MSQTLYFYTFPATSPQRKRPTSKAIFKSAKALFDNKGDAAFSEIIENNFRELNFEYIWTNACKIENHWTEFNKEAKFISPKEGTFFMADEKLIAALEKLIEEEIHRLLKDEDKKGLQKKLAEITLLMNDYDSLLYFFSENRLFINIF